jgi:hypothetical protein
MSRAAFSRVRPERRNRSVQREYMRIPSTAQARIKVAQ